MSLSHYVAVKPQLLACKRYRVEESRQSLISLASVCLGEGLLGTLDATFSEEEQWRVLGGGGGTIGGWRGWWPKPKWKQSPDL